MKMKPTMAQGTKFTALAGGMAPVPEKMTGKLEEGNDQFTMPLRIKLRTTHLIYRMTLLGNFFPMTQAMTGQMKPMRKKKLRAIQKE